jgi:hypothetical protein
MVKKEENDPVDGFGVCALVVGDVVVVQHKVVQAGGVVYLLDAPAHP